VAGPARVLVPLARAPTALGAAPVPTFGLADLRWWTRRTAGPIAHRWPAVALRSVGRDPARVARTCRRRAVVLAAWNALCVPLNAVLFGSLVWVLLAAEGAAQCALQWHLWRTHPDAFEDRIRHRQLLASAWREGRRRRLQEDRP
jgi:hypothetical protein